MVYWMNECKMGTVLLLKSKFVEVRIVSVFIYDATNYKVCTYWLWRPRSQGQQFHRAISGRGVRWGCGNFGLFLLSIANKFLDRQHLNGAKIVTNIQARLVCGFYRSGGEECFDFCIFLSSTNKRLFVYVAKLVSFSLSLINFIMLDVNSIKFC